MEPKGSRLPHRQTGREAVSEWVWRFGSVAASGLDDGDAELDFDGRCARSAPPEALRLMARRNGRRGPRPSALAHEGADAAKWLYPPHGLWLASQLV